MPNSGSPSKEIRVLLIEDDSGEALIVRKMLSGHDGAGGTVALEHADRLSKGLRRLEEQTFDLVLLDLGLPESQGLDTLRLVRDRVADLPIVVLTGLDDEDIGFTAVQEGAQDYQVKGRTDGTLLLRSIYYAVERRKLLAALEEKSNALEASAERFTRMVEDNVDGIVIVDTSGIIQFINPAAAALFGTNREQLPGTPFGYTIAGGEKMEITIERPSGNATIAEIRAVEIKWQKNPALLVSIRDITELRTLINEKETLLLQSKEHVKELVESQKLRKRYLTFIVHELKRPLHTVYDAVTKIKKKQWSDPETAEVVTSIDRNTCQMMEMVTHILKLEHAKLLEQIVDFSEITVRPLVEAVKKNFVKDLSNKNISFTVKVNAALVVTADLEKLMLIFFNLISNAVNFTSSGAITVLADYVGDNVQFTITDTGRGMTEQEQSSIRQILKDRDRLSLRSNGTGVGLVVARDLVALHGGRIWFESERGEGSKFHFTIPLRYFLTTREGTATLVQFAGSTLTAHTKAFKRVVTDLVEKSTKTVVLDLKRVATMSSLDVSALFGLYRIVSTADGALKLKNTSWQVRELLKMTKLDQVIEILEG